MRRRRVSHAERRANWLALPVPTESNGETSGSETHPPVEGRQL